MRKHCAACGGAGIRPFYRVDGITVHSVINTHSPEDALAFPRGNLELAVCPLCGFVSNRLFEGAKMHYCSDCEETQGYSETFRRWHRKLAESLIARYDLRGKTVIEIGCGKGEFLSMLCEMGENRGIGFDPAYVPSRNASAARDRIVFIEDLYSEKYASYNADFVCSKMTLEHIEEPLAFMQTVRRSIGDRTDTQVFFQVPDLLRVLRDVAFWDVYYEHCSYFTLGSLGRLFRLAGFDVHDLWSDYDGQYIMVDARPAAGEPSGPLAAEEAVEVTVREVDAFAAGARTRVAGAQEQFLRAKEQGKRVVLWGSGSKAVSYLSTVGVPGAIEYVVDINPYRQGTFLVGNGQRVVSPGFLKDYRPDTVLVMNEIYLDEIGRALAHLGLRPELRAVCGKAAVAA